MANAIAMIARCVQYHNLDTSATYDLPHKPDDPDDAAWLQAKQNEGALPMDEIGHGEPSTEAQVEG